MNNGAIPTQIAFKPLCPIAASTVKRLNEVLAYAEINGDEQIANDIRRFLAGDDTARAVCVKILRTVGWGAY